MLVLTPTCSCPCTARAFFPCTRHTSCTHTMHACRWAAAAAPSWISCVAACRALRPTAACPHGHPSACRALLPCYSFLEAYTTYMGSVPPNSTCGHQAAGTHTKAAMTPCPQLTGHQHAGTSARWWGFHGLVGKPWAPSRDQHRHQHAVPSFCTPQPIPTSCARRRACCSIRSSFYRRHPNPHPPPHLGCDVCALGVREAPRHRVVEVAAHDPHVVGVAGGGPQRDGLASTRGTPGKEGRQGAGGRAAR